MTHAATTLSYGPLVAGVVLLIGGIGLGVFVAMSAWRSDMARRLNELRWTYQAAAQPGEGPDAEVPQDPLRQKLFTVLEVVANEIGRFAWTNGAQQEKLRGLLVQAGIRRPDAPRLLMAVKVLCLIGFALLAAVGGIGADLSTGVLVAVGLGGGLAGTLLPEIVLKKLAQRRLMQITRRLPDALDLLIIFANAGYGMDQAIQRLSHAMRRSAPELCDEFEVTSDELRMLADRNQALENMALRTGLKPIRALVSTLNQAQKYGTPLSQALRVLAAEERNDRAVEMEERAGRMPVMITLPLIAMILPAVFLVVGTPAFIQAGHSLPKIFGGKSN